MFWKCPKPQCSWLDIRWRYCSRILLETKWCQDPRAPWSQMSSMSYVILDASRVVSIRRTWTILRNCCAQQDDFLQLEDDWPTTEFLTNVTAGNVATDDATQQDRCFVDAEQDPQIDTNTQDLIELERTQALLNSVSCASLGSESANLISASSRTVMTMTVFCDLNSSDDAVHVVRSVFTVLFHPGGQLRRGRYRMSRRRRVEDTLGSYRNEWRGRHSRQVFVTEGQTCIEELIIVEGRKKRKVSRSTSSLWRYKCRGKRMWVVWTHLWVGRSAWRTE